MFLKHIKWALLWAVLIFILSVIPGKDVPFSDFWDLFNLDKTIHAIVYFIQTILLNDALHKQVQFASLNKFSKSVSIISCTLYGGLIELAQGAFFQGRHTDLLDFIANTVGVLLGALFFEKTLNLFRL